MTRNRHEALSKVQGQESLIFQTHVTFSIDFPIHITIISSPMLLIRLISFVILVNESDFSRPAPTRFSPPLFMFFWILFLTKYYKIMS